MITADFDGDGHADLACTTEDGAYIQLSRGRAFTEPRQVSNAPGELAAGDMNGDGRTDLLISSKSLTLLVSDAAGGYRPYTVAPTLSGGISGSSSFLPFTYGDAVIGHFDNDGRMDIGVLTTYPTRLLLVFPGNGDGTVRPAVTTAVACFSRLAAADVNGDSRLDVFIYGCESHVLLGDGTGRFTPAPRLADASIFLDRAVFADVNGDGKPDIIGLLNSRNLAAVRHGWGDGSFDAPIYWPVGASPWDLAAADFDGDGLADIAAVNRAGSTEFRTSRSPTRGRRCRRWQVDCFAAISSAKMSRTFAFNFV